MMNHNFVAMILTHGRANSQITYKTLRKQGYTGEIRLLIDNEDSQAEAYYKNFPGEVIVFDKLKEAETTDACDNFHNRKVTLYARNAVFKIVKELGFQYFIQLDDDYDNFSYIMGKDYRINPNLRLIKDIDEILNALIDFYIISNANSIAISQRGDLLGGIHGGETKEWKSKRKCMGTWICDVDKPLTFCGTMNDDYSQFVVNGRRGDLYLQINMVAINTVPTQSTHGGMTDIYKDTGTYIKTFYSILQAPSCVRISMMGRTNKRVHHFAKSENYAAKIIREEYKKMPKLS
jgi:hypothetical protein